MTRPPLEVRIHDTSYGIWQENANDPSLHSDIYAVLIRDMRKRGWSIKADPRVLKHHRCISKYHRLGERGTLCCSIEITGCVVTVQFWSMTSPQDNRNGRRYDFDKLKRMSSHLDQLRVQLEFRRITRWLETLAPVTVTVSASSADMSPMAFIEKRYAEGWHTDKALGRTVARESYNRKSADGGTLRHGQHVWLADRKGRWTRGTAYYNLNSMWWVVAGGEVRNVSCHDIYQQTPKDLRTRRNAKLRRTRLERELALAVQRMKFTRAELLKCILFGADETFMIWARDKEAYYRAQYSGYAADSVHAGKYTRAEAEAECRRVPHELEMVCPDGTHVRFDRKAVA